MARAFKDLIVQETDGKPRLTFRSRDGTVLMEDVTVEVASTVLQEGDKWGALAANRLLEMDDDGVPQAVAPEFTPATAPAVPVSRERMSSVFGKLAAAVSALIAHLADGAKHITSAERTAWNTAKITADSANNTANAANNTAKAAMPKAGGSFTGDVIAYSTNRASSCLRNSEVRISGVTGTLQTTDKIIYVRK